MKIERSRGIATIRCQSGANLATCTTPSLLSSQICDNEWHYYVINVEFPAVTLFVDGVTYDPYLVTDDWPIHPSQIDMQLTVGACWQGEETGLWLDFLFHFFIYLFFLDQRLSPPLQCKLKSCGIRDFFVSTVKRYYGCP